jgi:multiple antibiotic resistance protein
LRGACPNRKTGFHFSGTCATPNQMARDYLISAFVTLLVVVDPLGLAPVFASLTAGVPPTVRRRIALNACLIAAAILCGAAIVGDWVLRQLGISLPAFRIAGGLLLFAVAFEMVLGWRSEREGKEAAQAVREEHVRHIAAFPLAIPLMAGPGAITATLLLAGRADGEPTAVLMLLGMIVAVTAVCLAAFTAAGTIARLIGTMGNLVLSRLLGVVLAALAVQYVVDGVRAVIA